MDKYLNNVTYLKTETNPRRLGTSRAEVAFVGRSNVGKSSLLNAVCQKKLAHTSQKPGKTRTINVFLAGHEQWIVDLPGYGFATGSEEERSKWPEMIEGYLLDRPTLQCVYVLIDAFVGPTKLDFQMIDWLRYNDVPLRVVANKADKVKVPQQEARRAEIACSLGLQPEALVWVSAAKGTGIKELRREVAELLEGKSYL